MLSDPIVRQENKTREGLGRWDGKQFATGSSFDPWKTVGADKPQVFSRTHSNEGTSLSLVPRPSFPAADAMTIALRANTAQMGSRFGGERRDELRDLRRKYLPRMIQNRYYTKPAGGHMIRQPPPKPQQLWGIWQYNRSHLDQS